VTETRVVAAVVVAAAVLSILALVVTVLALRRAARARRETAVIAEELAVQRELLEAFGGRLESYGGRLDGFGADAERLGHLVARARRATFPVLRATWRFGATPNQPVGTVDYVGGSEPALDVQVLVRWRDRDFFHTTLEMVGPLTRSVAFSGASCSRPLLDTLPLPDEPFRSRDAESAALAVMWTDPDGARRWWGQRYRFSFGFPEPEGPPLTGLAPIPLPGQVVPLAGRVSRRTRVTRPSA
jgi:hypothetical protein